METHKLAQIFPMMNELDYKNLKSDIKENGFDETKPIVLFERKILDGRNRFKACKELNVKPTFINYDGDNALSYVISSNLNRRHLTQTQRATIAVEVLPLLEEEARKRQGARTDLTSGKKFPKVEKGRPSEHAGKLFNVNERYIREAKKIKETNLDIFEDLKSGKKDFSDVKKDQREEKVQKQREEIKKQNLEQPKGDYDMIVIDPPWKVDFDYDPDHYMGRVANPYPEMTFEEIKKIKLPAKPNSILWLWTTHSQIWNAKNIMDSWGFEYKGILVWNKESMGIGKWLRKQCEFCLLGTKGKPFWVETNIRDIITEKKTSHSTKPESFYKMVEKICEGRKLDYFARKKREGWDVYGDEIK